jgi:hypothetical protein
VAHGKESREAVKRRTKTSSQTWTHRKAREIGGRPRPLQGHGGEGGGGTGRCGERRRRMRLGRRLITCKTQTQRSSSSSSLSLSSAAAAAYRGTGSSRGAVQETRHKGRSMPAQNKHAADEKTNHVPRQRKACVSCRRLHRAMFGAQCFDPCSPRVGRHPEAITPMKKTAVFIGPQAPAVSALAVCRAMTRAKCLHAIDFGSGLLSDRRTPCRCPRRESMPTHF